MARKQKLSLTKAVKYYKAGYPDDTYCTYAYCKNHPSESTAIIDEMSGVVFAPSLEEACKVLVECGYGADGNDDPTDWRSHVKPASDIRRAAGHYEPDYSDISIVKDLLAIVSDYNAALNESVGQHEKAEFRRLLNDTNCLADRIEMVYGGLLEEFE